MCSVDDGEGWKIFRDEYRTCAKPFRCYECSREVARGERYYFATGVCNGYTTWDSYKLCIHCREIAGGWLMAQCGGWLFGGIQEDLEEHRYEVGFDLSLGRAIVGMRRRWRKKDGSLMPVPA